MNRTAPSSKKSSTRVLERLPWFGGAPSIFMERKKTNKQTNRNEPCGSVRMFARAKEKEEKIREKKRTKTTKLRLSRDIARYMTRSDEDVRAISRVPKRTYHGGPPRWTRSLWSDDTAFHSFVKNNCVVVAVVVVVVGHVSRCSSFRRL